MKEYDFYIVPTPIGNLQDITLRALEVLKSVDIIACEDSRVTQKLLNHYNISTKCLSYHKYNENERVEKIVSLLEEGKKIALVSDAGTPLICDPGSVIVKELRRRGFRITALPGANAIATFLSQVSRPVENYTFIGFLPKSLQQMEDIFKNKKCENLIFYESPNRILATLKKISEVRKGASVAVGRELTKFFEEILVDKVENIVKYFEENNPKGEFVILVFAQEENEDDVKLESKINTLLSLGYKAKDISIILSKLYGINKNKLYKKIVEK